MANKTSDEDVPAPPSFDDYSDDDMKAYEGITINKDEQEVKRKKVVKEAEIEFAHYKNERNMLYVSNLNQMKKDSTLNPSF